MQQTFLNNMAKGTVVVAMSGGVDSSVAAWLLKEQGYRVIGMMLKLWSEKNSSDNRCCSVQAIEDAQNVAQHLSIPFYVLDYRAQFKSLVVEPFIMAYSQAITPNPCLLCNQKVRFTELLDQARKYGADYFSTGHYANLVNENGSQKLYKAKDIAKDQSYMLHRVSLTALQHSIFPLGGLLKEEVRALALQVGIPTAKKRESQDLCFLGDDGIKGFLHRNIVERSGPVKNLQGKLLGEHRGLYHYTVGQRKGLGLSLNQPHYVYKLDAEANTVFLAPLNNGDGAELGWSKFKAEDFHLTNGKLPHLPFAGEVKLRYHAPSHKAQITALKDDQAIIELENPVFPITPGQGAVFYLGEKVIGGGFIALP